MEIAASTQRKTEEEKEAHVFQEKVFFCIICYIHTMHLALLEINIQGTAKIRIP